MQRLGTTKKWIENLLPKLEISRSGTSILLPTPPTTRRSSSPIWMNEDQDLEILAELYTIPHYNTVEVEWISPNAHHFTFYIYMCARAWMGERGSGLLYASSVKLINSLDTALYTCTPVRCVPRGSIKVTYTQILIAFVYFCKGIRHIHITQVNNKGINSVPN